MSKPYHTLLVKHNRGDRWSIEFGDYSRKVVKQEAEDSYSDAHRTTIITTADNQAAIEDAVARLNA